MNVLSGDKKLAIVAAMVEGNSIRSVERMTGAHRAAEFDDSDATTTVYATDERFLEEVGEPARGFGFALRLV